jgi:hypothetical protein
LASWVSVDSFSIPRGATCTPVACLLLINEKSVSSSTLDLLLLCGGGGVVWMFVRTRTGRDRAHSVTSTVAHRMGHGTLRGKEGQPVGGIVRRAISPARRRRDRTPDAGACSPLPKHGQNRCNGWRVTRVSGYATCPDWPQSQHQDCVAVNKGGPGWGAGQSQLPPLEAAGGLLQGQIGNGFERFGWGHGVPAAAGHPLAPANPSSEPAAPPEPWAAGDEGAAGTAAAA